MYLMQKIFIALGVLSGASMGIVHYFSNNWFTNESMVYSLIGLTIGFFGLPAVARYLRIIENETSYFPRTLAEIKPANVSSVLSWALAGSSAGLLLTSIWHWLLGTVFAALMALVSLRLRNVSLSKYSNDRSAREFHGMREL